MAWGYEVIATVPIGDLWLVTGTWDGAGVTGGDIDTGFTTTVAPPILSHTGAAVEAAVAVVNEAYTKAAPGPGKFTVVCTSDDDGGFIAICR